MSSHVDLLIPWYLNGTLSSDEVAEFEEHLAACTGCRELVDQSRELTRDAGSGSMEPPEHVPAQLLVRYAEAPDSLKPDTRAWIVSRVEECEVCREALHRLNASMQAALEQRSTATFAERLWQGLAGSILRPAPALAYLFMLIVALPLVWMVSREVGQGPPMLAPLVIDVSGERVTRDGTAIDTPLRLQVEAGAPVVMHLETSLDADDLADPQLGFVLQLELDDRVLWSRSRAASDFTGDDGAVLSVILDTGQLRPGRVYRVVLRAKKPGDPLDDVPLFRRSFVLQHP